VLLVHSGCLVDETKAAYSSQSSGSPPLLSYGADWVDVVDMWVLPPLAVNGVHDSDGEKVLTPSSPCTIPNVGSERLLRFLLHGAKLLT
jgi:hypothetical protein